MYNEVLYENGFDSDTGEFQLDGAGFAECKGGKLYLDDSVIRPSGNGLTYWLKREFEGDLRIEYDAAAVDINISSNLNAFFFAKKLNGSPAYSGGFSGHYGEYHKECSLYIFTFVDAPPNDPQRTKGWSRLRKNPRFNLLSELDRAAEFAKWYHIAISKKGGHIEASVDGEVLHSFDDTDDYKSGAFGFRTWKTRLCVDNLQILRL